MKYRLRASSISDLFDCPHRWEGVHLLGMRSAKHWRAHLGTALHEGGNAFDQARMDNVPIKPEDAVGQFVKSFKSPEDLINWDGASQRIAEGVGAALITHYCNRISPNYTFSMVEHKLPEVELEVEGVSIIISGQVDRIFEQGREWGVADLKSSSRLGMDHRPQLAAYDLLASEYLEQESGLQPRLFYMKTTGKPEVGEDIQNTGADLLLGTQSQAGMLEYAVKSYLKPGSFPGNTRSNFCSEKFCPRWSTCTFKQ